MEINYVAILIGAILSMIIGAIWYGPLFGKKWMHIIGADASDLEKRKEMQKKAGPLYAVQFVLTLFQITVLAFLITNTSISHGVSVALLAWAAFIIPTLAGATMWNNDSKDIKWARFLIQGGYQLVIFIVFGLILTYWL